MRSFKFSGSLQSSKSMLNRAWTIKSYFPELKILGDSRCDDVAHMKSGLLQLAQHKIIDCGEAGTVLRFLALRASREVGEFELTGSPRLMARANDDIVYVLDQLGVQAVLSKNSLKIISQGWKTPMFPLRIHRDKSSQFASALLLNSWNLSFPIEFELMGGTISEAYWRMSVELVKKLGMTVEQRQAHFRIPAQQKVLQPSIKAELDYSSAFAICAAAALAGEVEILNCDSKTLQPDFVFIETLKKMNVPVSFDGNHLVVKKASKLKAIEMDLSSSPDMFPVLAVLCAFAEGSSHLFGAPHLIHKESNRIKKTNELLQGLGVISNPSNEGIEVRGLTPTWSPHTFEFDPDSDHRMAMAAGLLKLKKVPVHILRPEVVSKSFPEFWSILGVKP